MSVEEATDPNSSFGDLIKAVRNDVVFVTGPPTSGKTSLVKRLFELFKQHYLHAYVDCYSIRNQSNLLSTICQALYCGLNVRRSYLGKEADQLPKPGAAVLMHDFPRIIATYRKLWEYRNYKHAFIVLDQVEVFERTMLVETVAAFCRANVLGLKLIIISNEDPCDLFHSMNSISPAIAASLQDRYQIVACKAWSKDAIVHWILESMPAKSDEDVYEKFVKNVVHTVYSTQSKDPNQIRMYCREHFADYMETYRGKLKEHIISLLKRDPNADISDDTFDEYKLSHSVNTAQTINAYLEKFRVSKKSQKESVSWTHKDVEIKMTTNTAILLIAAYVAAYTKISDDKKNFVRYQRKKATKSRRIHEQTDNLSKPFTLERLVQIYLKLLKNAIQDQNIPIMYNHDCVLSDVERLENLNILKHQTGLAFCSEARYKLSQNVKRDYVQRLANNHNVDFEGLHGIFCP